MRKSHDFCFWWLVRLKNVKFDHFKLFRWFVLFSIGNGHFRIFSALFAFKLYLTSRINRKQAVGIRFKHGRNFMGPGVLARSQ
jgi:hypothetical protein